MSGINVTIGANPAPLKKGIAEAESALRGFDGKASESVANLAKIGAAAVAAGAAIGVTLVKNAMDAIDAQSKLAQQLGATVAEMTALQRAGDLAGVSSEALTTGLRKLNNTIGEAQAGNKAAADSLARLGLTADQLSTMTVDERMNAVAIAISGMADQMQRAAAAQDLFGKTGQTMLPLLQDSGEQLRIAAEQTKAWGLALSDVDAAKVEAANDALSSISLVFDGIINRIAVKFAPLVEAIGKSFEETATKTGGFAEVASIAFNAIIKAGAIAGDVIRTLDGLLDLFRIAWKDIEIAAFSAGYAISAALDAIPGVDMTQQKKAFQALGATAVVELDKIGKHFDEVMFGESLESKADKWIANLDQKSTEAATKAVEARNNAAATAVDTAAPAVAAATAAATPVDTAKADAEAARIAQEEAAAAERHSRMADEIATEVAMEWEKQSLLTQATKAGQEERLAFEKMTGDARVKHVAGALAEMTASTANSNKKMFELNKAAGITNALINTYEGVTKNLAAYPGPLGIAMAAASLASGMAQVSAIKNQSFGGKGGGGAVAAPSTIAGGGGGATPAAVGGGGAAREVVVSGVNPNDLFSGAQLVELINRAQRDGAVVMRFAS